MRILNIKGYHLIILLYRGKISHLTSFRSSFFWSCRGRGVRRTGAGQCLHDIDVPFFCIHLNIDSVFQNEGYGTKTLYFEGLRPNGIFWHRCPNRGDTQLVNFKSHQSSSSHQNIIFLPTTAKLKRRVVILLVYVCMFHRSA